MNCSRQILEVVGDSGAYQNIIIAILMIVSVQNSVILAGNPYIFAVAPYTNCPEPYVGVTLCTKYPCSLPFSQRAQY